MFIGGFSILCVIVFGSIFYSCMTQKEHRKESVSFSNWGD